MKRLLYIADPMCSWCYGFLPEMDKLIKHYNNKIPFSIIMGGLRPGGGTPWDTKMKDFLRHHWEEVGERTGQAFNFDLFQQDKFNYDTEPSCRAVVVVREMSPGKTYVFYKAIQHNFYFLNQDPNELEFYLPICKSLDIDAKKFEKNFLSDKYKSKTKQDFAHSRNIGIRGFPSLVLAVGESLRLVTNGYTTFEKMQETIDLLLDNKE